MPASGVPTVYIRLPKGWDGYKTTGSYLDAIAKYVFGASAAKLISVLANSPGGMSLLPFTNFMTTHETNPKTKVKPWLRLVARNLNGEVITATLPKSDPYEEIYSDQTSWWQMVDMGKLDPTGTIRGTNAPKTTPPATGSVVGLGGVPESSDSTDLGSDLDNDPEIRLSDKLDVNRESTKQVFVINGYEHSASYGNEEVLKSVLYSVAKLIKPA